MEVKKKYILKIILRLIFLLFCAPVLSQPVLFNKSKTVVVSTLGENNDLRAISLLCAIPEIEIKGVIVGGDNTALKKVTGFLNKSGYSMPVTGDHSGVILSQIIHTSDKKIIIISLGSFSNIADCIGKDSSLISRIERVIVYRLHKDNEEILKLAETGIRIDLISDLEQKKVDIDVSGYFKTSTIASEGLKRIPQRNKMQFLLSSEIAAIYFAEPELFDIIPVIGKIKLRYNTDYDVPSIRAVVGDLVGGTYLSGNNVVFSHFPGRKEMFKYDIRNIMDSVISRYGHDEWEACVMTDEFHGHLGVYSIVGAKMGIKARTLFGVGPDVLKVVSYAGTMPPYSCLNDGIQVSTGSTLGMGLISVAHVDKTRSEADFTYNNKTVRISLKKEYIAQVEANIKEGIVKFGLMDDGYWKMVRRAAIKYWLDWDRDEIFEIQEVN